MKTKKPSASALSLKATAAAMLVALLSACGGTTAPTVDTPTEEPIELPTELPTDPPDAEAPVAAADCSAPNHLALTDIESVTDWINALPKPLELPCFIESLPRPLYVNMTESVFSAQPSNGKGNPRVFIFLDRLMLSVVPQEAVDPTSTEPRVNLLEMSFNTEGIQSVKAEIAFPATETLSYGDAYQRLVDGKLATSTCGVCHADELKIGEYDGVPVFQSQMLSPYLDFEVTVGLLKNEAHYCDPVTETHRCAMLAALVGEGDIYWQEFAADIPILR